MPTRKGPIRVLHYGLGPIGAAVARQVAARRGFRIVGAVDIDPAKAGRDLGEVAGAGRVLRVRVSDQARRTIKSTRPDVVVLCTLSSLKKVTPQIEEILDLKVPIVSTTEELAYPTGANMKYARAIHQLAKKKKVAVLGTGVNPGFTMDALPIVLTGVCERVDSIRVDRIQDARVRRLPFQQKIGAGLTREQFQKKVDDGSVRHVGLAESVSMIADAMGWKLDRVTDEIEPKIATSTVSSEFLAVDPGYVCGLVQDGIGYRDGKPIVTLHMEAYLGAPESYDQVEIVGSPNIRSRIAGGVHGDVATASITVNSIPKILEVPPGLHTMRDMPIPSYFGG
jgi:4-hydroxy-tetrahydrodipicolinate reductase